MANHCYREGYMNNNYNQNTKTIYIVYNGVRQTMCVSGDQALPNKARLILLKFSSTFQLGYLMINLMVNQFMSHNGILRVNF